MSFDQKPAAGAEPPPGINELSSLPASATSVPPTLRRPFRSFFDEARDAAQNGLKSSVVFTAAGLTLTFEKPDGVVGAGEADNLASPPKGGVGAARTGEGNQPAPKPWR